MTPALVYQCLNQLYVFPDPKPGDFLFPADHQIAGATLYNLPVSAKIIILGLEITT